MDIEELKERFLLLDGKTSERMRRYVHYKSMRNFLNHFDEIESASAKQKIILFMDGYFNEIEAGGYIFDSYESADLAKKYILNISGYYKTDSNFMRNLRFSSVVIYGFMADSLLFLSGFLSHFHHIPVATTIFLSYYLFIVLFKVRPGRVYGLFY